MSNLSKSIRLRDENKCALLTFPLFLYKSKSLCSEEALMSGRLEGIAALSLWYDGSFLFWGSQFPVDTWEIFWFDSSWGCTGTWYVSFLPHSSLLAVFQQLSQNGLSSSVSQLFSSFLQNSCFESSFCLTLDFFSFLTWFYPGKVFEPVTWTRELYFDYVAQIHHCRISAIRETSSINIFTPKTMHACR